MSTDDTVAVVVVVVVCELWSGARPSEVRTWPRSDGETASPRDFDEMELGVAGVAAAAAAAAAVDLTASSLRAVEEAAAAAAESFWNCCAETWEHLSPTTSLQPTIKTFFCSHTALFRCLQPLPLSSTYEHNNNDLNKTLL